MTMLLAALCIFLSLAVHKIYQLTWLKLIFEKRRFKDFDKSQSLTELD